MDLDASELLAIVTLVLHVGYHEVVHLWLVLLLVKRHPLLYLLEFKVNREGLLFDSRLLNLLVLTPEEVEA